MSLGIFTVEFDLLGVPGMNKTALHNLPVERLHLVEELWDSAIDQGILGISEAQRQELDRRLNAYELDGNPGRPAKDVLALEG